MLGFPERQARRVGPFPSNRKSANLERGVWPWHRLSYRNERAKPSRGADLELTPSEKELSRRETLEMYAPLEEIFAPTFMRLYAKEGRRQFALENTRPRGALVRPCPYAEIGREGLSRLNDRGG